MRSAGEAKVASGKGVEKGSRRVAMDGGKRSWKDFAVRGVRGLCLSSGPADFTAESFLQRLQGFFPLNVSSAAWARVLSREYSINMFPHA